MEQKERMYKLAKTISSLKEAFHYSDVSHMSNKCDNELFEAHCYIMKALEHAEEALQIEYYEGEED